MTYREQLEDALAKADEAGDEDDARALAAELERVLAAEAGPSKLESFQRAVAEAGTFGFADELVGAANELKRRVTGKGPGYKEARDTERAAVESAAAAHPGYDLAGQLVGSLAVPGGSLGVAGRGAGLATRLASAAARGGAAGALRGAGGAEELADIPEAALAGGAAGAALSGGTVAGRAALKAPISALKATRRALQGEIARAALRKAEETEAGQALASSQPVKKSRELLTQIERLRNLVDKRRRFAAVYAGNLGGDLANGK